MPADSSRREFLKISAGAFAATGLSGASIAGNSANEKLVGGAIGGGGRGRPGRRSTLGRGDDQVEQ